GRSPARAASGSASPGRCPTTRPGAQREVLAVPAVDEAAGDGPGPGIEVLVTAPAREIDVPIVQRQGDVPRGVRQVQPDDAALLVRGGRQPRNVVDLAGQEVDAGEEDDGDFPPQA